MSPATSGRLAPQLVKLSDALEIRDGIIFDSYPGLPHILKDTVPFETSDVPFVFASKICPLFSPIGSTPNPVNINNLFNNIKL